MFDPTLFTLSGNGARVVPAREAEADEILAGAFDLVSATARTAASLYRRALVGQRRTPTWLSKHLEGAVLPSHELIETIWLDSLRHELDGADLAETGISGVVAIDFVRAVRSTGTPPSVLVDDYDLDQCVTGMLLVVSAGLLEMSTFVGADPQRLLEITTDYATSRNREDRSSS